MKTYKPWDFCKAIDCDALGVIFKNEKMKKRYCHKCYAYQFYQYLRGHDQIFEEGSNLAKVVQNKEPCREIRIPKGGTGAVRVPPAQYKPNIKTIGFKPAPDHPKPDYRPPAQPTRYTREEE